MTFFQSLFGPPNVQKLRAKGDVKGLIKALSYKKDSLVRQAAARALGQIGDAQAVEPLIAALKDPESHCDWDAKKALVQIGTPALEPLKTVLTDGQGGVGEAAYVLGEIGGSEVVEPLIAVLQAEEEYLVEEAARALGKIGDPRAVQPLIEALDKTYVKSKKGSIVQRQL